MNQLLVCHTLGPQLMKLLGIPEHCTSFELRCAVDEIVTVKCEYHPVRDDVQLDAFGALMGEYELIPRAGGRKALEAVTAIDFDAWMRLRTSRAHAEFIARTSRLPSAT